MARTQTPNDCFNGQCRALKQFWDVLFQLTIDRLPSVVDFSLVRCIHEDFVASHRSHRRHFCKRQYDERLTSVTPDQRPEQSGKTSCRQALRIRSRVSGQQCKVQSKATRQLIREINLPGPVHTCCVTNCRDESEISTKVNQSALAGHFH